jgi:hypothetical protein
VLTFGIVGKAVNGIAGMESVASMVGKVSGMRPVALIIL